jgi:DNA-binding NtrC family response regulator
LGIKESKFELEMLGALNPYNHQLRQGAVALAEGGTLYLHEVGELPAACQTLLLRLVESNTYSPVNSSDTYNSDFRLIASSSQDLMAMVEHGKFRNDLLHHINTLTIRAPSLNERREDIADLVRSILLEMSVASVKQLTPEAMEVLCDHK